MLNFFYDSLETLKKVKKPTNAEVTNLTIIIFVVVIIAALMFAFMDGVFGELYNTIYETLSGMFDGSAAPTAPVPAAEVVIDANTVPAPSAVDAAIDVPAAE